MINIYEQVSGNKRKSMVVITGFIVFVTAAVYFMTYAFGYDISVAGIALIISGLMSFSSYYFSDKIILTLSSAKPASREEYFDFYTVTENLCLATQLPMPKLYVIEDTAMNAFATGRDPKHAVVCATTGLLSRLNRTEIEGVVAHELSHVRNYDIRLMSLVTVLAGVLTLLADWLLRASYWGGGKKDRDNNQLGMVLMIAGFALALLSPIIATIIKLAISRSREFLADASAVAMTKYPEGLASALEKISRDQEPLEAANKATAHLYIANPLKNNHNAVGIFASMFSTHPPIEQRLAALRQMR